jgi:hypothetical protein
VALPPELLDWESRGTYLRVGPSSLRVYAQSIGAAPAGPASTLLVVHGFPESSFSFARNPATGSPIHLCWGALDRVAPPAIAEHLSAPRVPRGRG